MMKCPKCEGMMSHEHLIDAYESRSTWACDGWRCVHCGVIIDPVILQNRKKSKTVWEQKPMTETIQSLIRKALAIYLVLWILLLGLFTPESVAMLIPSMLPETQGHALTQRVRDIEQIQVFLENKLVTQRLSDLGFTAEEIQARLAQLTDHQIHQMAQHLDSLQMGGDALGIFVALLVIAILVVGLLWLTQHKVIITK